MLKHSQVAIYFLPLVAVVVFLSACTKMEIENHSLQFNEAVGTLENQLLLLNAVRASKDYPVRFTKLNSYTGTSRWDGTYAPDVPFPLSPDRQYKVLPSFKFSPGINNMQLADLNTAEAQRALKTNIDFNAWYYFLRSGWDEEVVNNIAIERVSIHERIFKLLVSNAERYCRQHADDTDCRRIAEIMRNCSRGSTIQDAFTVRRFNGQRLAVFFNRPAYPCVHERFQVALTLLHLSGFSLKPHTRRFQAKEPTTAIKKGTKLDSVDVNVNVSVGEKPSSGAKTNNIVSFNDRRLTELVDFMLQRRDLDRVGVNPFEISLRSPESMVRFLGEVVASELYVKKAHVVTVISEDGAEVPLFLVQQGGVGLQPVAVSIVGPEGERFSIPRPEHGAKDRHRSLQSLAFVEEVMGAAISLKALPPVTNVIFSPSQ